MFDLTTAARTAWAAGVAFFGLRYMLAWIASERLRRSSGTARTFRGHAVVATTAVRSPLTAGLFRSVILVPEGDTDEAALVHEAAHVRRRDAIARAIAHAASVIYWFHPLVWVLAALAWLEQERACDDVVLAEGIDSVRYATLLVAAARHHRGAAALGLGGSQLRARIVSIVDTNRSRAAMTLRAALSASSLSIAATAGAATLSLALLGPVDLPTSEELPDVPLVQVNAPSPAAQVLLQAAAKEKTWEGDLVAQRARWGLSRMRAGELSQPLQEALEDRDWRVRAYAAWCLAATRDASATPRLVALLEDPVWRMRGMAAFALAEIGDARASAAMRRALDDDAWQVRVEAVRYLGNLHDAQFRGDLEAHINDPHAAVRMAVEEALRKP